MATWPERASIPLLCALMFLFAGCGGPPRIPIQGTVTYKNAPLDEGIINFIPEDTARGTMGVASVTAGKYALPADKGLVPGTYRVSIVEGRLPDPKASPGGPRRSKELSTEKETIEVTATGSREFNFVVN